MGLIKKYNRKAKLIKSQELQLKKDIAQIIKKKAQALPNKQNAMEEEGNSVKYVFKITEKKKQIDNEDCKPKKGGYFIVKNSLFEIQETLHHESKPYL